MSKHEEADVVEFWLTGPKYIQQVGDSWPKYVDASPTVPVKVVLPAKVDRGGVLVDQPEGPFMKRVKPDKPKGVVPNLKKDPIRRSHEAVAASAPAAGRAADQ